MKVSYDPKADSIYILFSEKDKSSKTVELNDDVLADYSGDKLIGIEVNDASKKLPQKNLESITLNVTTTTPVSASI